MGMCARCSAEPIARVAVAAHSFLILWIGAFAVYSRTDEMLLYTNWLTQNQHKMPHYQDLLYEPAIVTTW